MKIFCSTGCFKGNDFFTLSKNFINMGVDAIELSSGEFVEDVESKCFDLINTSKLMLHNYFPPPKEPFVLNLASSDEGIAQKTLDFYISGIELSGAINSKYFGIHAGFLSDFEVGEIGKKINYGNSVNRSEGLELLISRVGKLSNVAKRLDVTLLIENNVLSIDNLGEKNQHIMLLAEPREVNFFFNSINSNVKLLLDVGHLKVSSNTLKFDLLEAFYSLDPWVGGYHLSDNFGLYDDHMIFDDSVWFMSHLNKSVDFATIEVGGCSLEQIAKLWRRLSNFVSS